tara:strand:- start:181 stop:633 length:453 start_codon:yes stop_codon:yes gene_type:complete
MFIIFKFIFSILLPTKVYLNIEKVNPIITHTGITFINNKNSLRYDFRAFNNNDNYITTEESRKNINEMFPKINPYFFELKGFNQHREDIKLYSKQIYLGYTNYSLQEIIKYEKTINKNYILGIHDCRHYTNDLTQWCLNYSIPIWDLDSI